MLCKIVGVLYDETRKQQVGFKLFNLSADFINNPKIRATAVSNSQLMTMIQNKSVLLENVKIDSTGLSITDGQASDLPCYTATTGQCFRNADVYIVLARVVRNGELLGYSILSSSGVYCNASVPELKKKLNLRYFNIVNSDSVIRAKHGDMFEKEYVSNEPVRPAVPSQGKTRVVPPVQVKSPERAVSAPNEGVAKSPEKAEVKAAPVNVIHVTVTTQAPKYCIAKPKPLVEEKDVDYMPSMILRVGDPVLGITESGRGLYLAGKKMSDVLDCTEVTTLRLPADKNMYTITTLYVNNRGEVIACLVVDSNGRINKQAKSYILGHPQLYTNLDRDAVATNNGKNIVVKDYNYEIPSIIYVEPATKVGRGGTGFHRYNGKPKILPIYRMDGKKAVPLKLITSDYLGALDDEDLTAIYDYVNEEVFATASAGRLPSFKVKWGRYSGLFIKPYQKVVTYDIQQPSFAGTIGSAHPVEYTAVPDYISLETDVIVRKPEFFYAILLYYMVLFASSLVGRESYRRDLGVLVEKRTGIDLEQFFANYTEELDLDGSLKNFICPTCGNAVAYSPNKRVSKMQCSTCGQYLFK